MAILKGPYRSGRRRGLVVTLMMLCLIAAPVPAPAQMVAGEYELKAAFLHNFSRFVAWPPDRLRDAQPFVIGIVGADPFGRAIETIDGKTTNGHRIIVRHLRWNDDLTGAHILFISGSELSRLPAILQALEGHSVLTVGDFDRFAARGGMVELRTSNGRVQLDINLTAALNVELKVSSRLLQVARVVSRPGEVK